MSTALQNTFNFSSRISTLQLTVICSKHLSRNENTVDNNAGNEFVVHNLAGDEFLVSVFRFNDLFWNNLINFMYINICTSNNTKNIPLRIFYHR